MIHYYNGSFKQRHTSTFRKEKSSSTPAAGFDVVFRSVAVEFVVGGTGAGVVFIAVVAFAVVALIVVVALVVTVALVEAALVVLLVVVVLVVAVVGVVIILEFLTIVARNEARVDGKKPFWGSISWTHKHKGYTLLNHHRVVHT